MQNLSHPTQLCCRRILHKILIVASFLDGAKRQGQCGGTPQIVPFRQCSTQNVSNHLFSFLRFISVAILFAGSALCDNLFLSLRSAVPDEVLAMGNLRKTTVYLEPDVHAHFQRIAVARKLPVSFILKELADQELARYRAGSVPGMSSEQLVLHIAIGVDALLKFSASPAAFEAAKEARERRLGRTRDAH